MYERWANGCLTILAAAMIRRRNRCRQRIAWSPYAWSIPRLGESWFDLHYYDATIPEEFFRQQLRVRRNTFNRILNLLGHRLVRQPSRFRDPLPPEEILALGLYRLGHGNSYVTIGPSFNLGKATAIEGVQDVVEALYEIRNEYIKFPETEAETVAARNFCRAFRATKHSWCHWWFACYNKSTKGQCRWLFQSIPTAWLYNPSGS